MQDDRVPTFEQNMTELHSLKMELVKLHYIFSPVHDTMTY